MRIVAYISLLLISCSGVAQEPDTLRTDSSMVVTTEYPGGVEVRELMRAKNLIYYRFYYQGSKVIHETATYDTLGRRIGIGNEFDEKGRLEFTKDYDRGIWTVVNVKRHRYGKLQDRMRAKGDSLIKAIYGLEFFSKNVVWCIDGSYMYNSDQQGDWDDVFSKEPKKFLLRYNIKFDGTHVYDEMIEFELDSVGKFIPDPYESIYGFEQLPDSADKVFKLTHAMALDISRQHGLVETDTTRAEAFLKWEGLRTHSLYNGHFRFYVTQRIGSDVVRGARPNHFTRTNHYRVWVFNPWSGEFIDEKKMDQETTWEGAGGYSTGLFAPSK